MRMLNVLYNVEMIHDMTQCCCAWSMVSIQTCMREQCWGDHHASSSLPLLTCGVLVSHCITLPRDACHFSRLEAVDGTKSLCESHFHSRPRNLSWRHLYCVYYWVRSWCAENYAYLNDTVDYSLQRQWSVDVCVRHEITTLKPSCAISGVQHTEGGPVEYSHQLPQSCRLSW